MVGIHWYPASHIVPLNACAAPAPYLGSSNDPVAVMHEVKSDAEYTVVPFRIVPAVGSHIPPFPSLPAAAATDVFPLVCAISACRAHMWA